jgi:hypothetical protein
MQTTGNHFVHEQKPFSPNTNKKNAIIEHEIVQHTFLPILSIANDPIKMENSCASGAIPA